MADGAKEVLPGESGTPNEGKFSKSARITWSLLLLGIGFGFGGWWTLLRTPPVNSADQPQIVSAKAVLPLESFTVNLEKLVTPEGKSKLKADLLKALNSDVPALGAEGIYFTDFLVQR